MRMKIGIISDYAKVFSGYAFASEDLVNDGVPVIKIGNIQNGIVNKECDSCYSKVISKKLEKYLLKDTDFLIAMTGAGSVGRAGIMIEDKGNYLINQRVAIVRANENANREYLYYFFRLPYIERFLYSLGIGAGQPNISPNDILKLKSMFHLEESQTKISTILFAYDKLIEINNKRIKALEQMAENLYKEWFVRFRFPGYETAEFENGIPKGWILSTANSYYAKKPRSWHFGNVSEFGEFKRGKNITSTEMIEGDIPVISAGLEPSGYHCDFNVKGKNITVSASGANAGYIKYNLDNIWAADCSYYQDEKYLWYVYNTLKFLQPVLKNMQCGAAQPHVYPKHINHLNVIIPADDIILKYCQIVNPLYDEIKIIHDNNINLIKQRDLLLPRLMSGKLEVKM